MLFGPLAAALTARRARYGAGAAYTALVSLSIYLFFALLNTFSRLQWPADFNLAFLGRLGFLLVIGPLLALCLGACLGVLVAQVIAALFRPD